MPVPHGGREGGRLRQSRGPGITKTTIPSSPRKSTVKFPGNERFYGWVEHPPRNDTVTTLVPPRLPRNNRAECLRETNCGSYGVPLIFLRATEWGDFSWPRFPAPGNIATDFKPRFPALAQPRSLSFRNICELIDRRNKVHGSVIFIGRSCFSACPDEKRDTLGVSVVWESIGGLGGLLQWVAVLLGSLWGFLFR